MHGIPGEPRSGRAKQTLSAAARFLGVGAGHSGGMMAAKIALIALLAATLAGCGDPNPSDPGQGPAENTVTHPMP